jgi:hypothetical protein
MLPFGNDPSSGAAARCTAPLKKREQLDANRQQKRWTIGLSPFLQLKRMTAHPFKLQSVVLAAANAQNETTSQCATQLSTPRTLRAGLQARLFSIGSLAWYLSPKIRLFFLQSLPLFVCSSYAPSKSTNHHHSKWCRSRFRQMH